MNDKALLKIDRENNIASVCMFCDWSKQLTGRLNARGWQVSHGVCKPCLAREMAEAKAVKEMEAAGGAVHFKQPFQFGRRSILRR